MAQKKKRVLSPEALETLRRTAAYARQVRQEKRKARELLGEAHPYTPPKRRKKAAIKKPVQREMKFVYAATSNKSILQSYMVNNPDHYKVGGIETIDFIEAKGLSYNLGNVVKYVTRAGHKGNRKEDLEKSRWYLTREIEAS